MSHYWQNGYKNRHTNCLLLLGMVDSYLFIYLFLESRERWKEAIIRSQVQAEPWLQLCTLYVITQTHRYTQRVTGQGELATINKEMHRSDAGSCR